MLAPLPRPGNAFSFRNGPHEKLRADSMQWADSGCIHRGHHMNIRPILKLAAPLALAMLLAGCITDPYQYRGGYGGDYYYGQPSVEYRHHGGYYGPYGYGHPYYGRSGWSFGLRYGYPYGYGYGGYGYGGRYGYGGWPYWYGWPGYPPIVVRPGPDPDPGHGGDNDDDGPPPWRDLDRLRTGGPNPPIQNEPNLPRVLGSSQPPRVRVDRPSVERPAPRRTVDRPSRPVYEGSRVQRARSAAEDRDDR